MYLNTNCIKSLHLNQIQITKYQNRLKYLLQIHGLEMLRISAHTPKYKPSLQACVIMSVAIINPVDS